MSGAHGLVIQQRAQRAAAPTAGASAAAGTAAVSAVLASFQLPSLDLKHSAVEQSTKKDVVFGTGAVTDSTVATTTLIPGRLENPEALVTKIVDFCSTEEQTQLVITLVKQMVQAIKPSTRAMQTSLLATAMANTTATHAVLHQIREAGEEGVRDQFFTEETEEKLQEEFAKVMGDELSRVFENPKEAKAVLETLQLKLNKAVTERQQRRVRPAAQTVTAKVGLARQDIDTIATALETAVAKEEDEEATAEEAPKTGSQRRSQKARNSTTAIAGSVIRKPEMAAVVQEERDSMVGLAQLVQQLVTDYRQAEVEEKAERAATATPVDETAAGKTFATTYDAASKLVGKAAAEPKVLPFGVASLTTNEARRFCLQTLAQLFSTPMDATRRAAAIRSTTAEFVKAQQIACYRAAVAKVLAESAVEAVAFDETVGAALKGEGEDYRSEAVMALIKKRAFEQMVKGIYGYVAGSTPQSRTRGDSSTLTSEANLLYGDLVNALVSNLSADEMLKLSPNAKAYFAVRERLLVASELGAKCPEGTMERDLLNSEKEEYFNGLASTVVTVTPVTKNESEATASAPLAFSDTMKAIAKDGSFTVQLGEVASTAKVLGSDIATHQHALALGDRKEMFHADMVAQGMDGINEEKVTSKAGPFTPEISRAQTKKLDEVKEKLLNKAEIGTVAVDLKKPEHKMLVAGAVHVVASRCVEAGIPFTIAEDMQPLMGYVGFDGEIFEYKAGGAKVDHTAINF